MLEIDFPHNTIGMVVPIVLVQWIKITWPGKEIPQFVKKHKTRKDIGDVHIIHCDSARAFWFKCELKKIIKEEEYIPSDILILMKRLINRLNPYLKEAELRGYIDRWD